MAAGREPTARLRPTPSEDPPIDLDAAVSANLGPIVIVLTVALVVLIIAVVALARRTRSLELGCAGSRAADDGDLEDVLGAHLDRVHALGREVERLVARTARLEAARRGRSSGSGSSGSTRSRTPAATRASRSRCSTPTGNGWVLSSLHARSGTRVYAKAIREGRSEAALSEEEAAAIEQATA